MLDLWMWDMINISVSATGRMNSLVDMSMLMVLNHSGDTPNGDLSSLKELRNTSFSISKNVNGDGRKPLNNLRIISGILSKC